MANKPSKRPKNDYLTEGFGKLVPPEYRLTDRFLDVVTWNLRYFHDRDQKRVKMITQIMSAINADIFVLQEIVENSLGVVINKLENLGAGHYEVAYGTTGGNQRIAMMWDLDWVRAKDDRRELFGKREVLTSDGKDVFPRLPLLGVFIAISNPSFYRGSGNPFDFQLVGLHLKSQRGGGALQRQLAARKLTDWLEKEAPKVDADVILTGDWNQKPDAAEWEPFRRLESDKKALFTSLNNKNEISHLMYQNKTEIGTRLDLGCVNISASHELAERKSEVIRWKSLDDLLASNPFSQKIKAYIKEVSYNISDHMPVVTRFYFTERS